MDEFKKLYTVEDIAKMTSLTSRTIRNYLKDGSLQGAKIGGQWRFTMDNIKRLFNHRDFLNDMHDHKKQQILDFIDSVNTDMQGEIQVCAIIDCYCENSKAGHQIYDKLVKVINNRRDDDLPPAKFYYEFVEKEKKARFTLFGEPDYIVKTLQLL
jgi:excisionase family DNA binding protein